MAQTLAQISSNSLPHARAAQKRKLSTENRIAVECLGHQQCTCLSCGCVLRRLQDRGADVLRHHPQRLRPCWLVDVFLCEFENLLPVSFPGKLPNLPSQL